MKNNLKDLNKCIKIKPDYADAYVERGLIKQRMGDLKGAENDYKKAKEIEPTIQLPRK
ncbi:MAG TPA: tetratricopeptide repeat protein [Candidatus Nanoarchaeia archaeon]|nr:tetratricopeptide repeat protein [Candidatus Nanoarchaeia archaeon]